MFLEDQFTDLNGGDVIKTNEHNVNSSEDYETSDSTGEEPQASDRFYDSPNEKLTDAIEDLKSLPLPDTVTLLEGPCGAKVYLVGTAHFSEKSQQDVSQVLINFIILIILKSILEQKYGRKNY